MFSGGKRSFPDPEIPVWVDGRKKWVTGISKRTTFNDIMFALLRHQYASNCTPVSDEVIHQQLSAYQIIEVRDEIERPLKSNSKVIKVWRTWSSSRARITLFLRRTERPSSHNSIVQKNELQQSFLQRLLSRRGTIRRGNTPQPDQSPTARYSVRQPVETLLAKDKMLSNQLVRINELNKEIVSLENKIGSDLSEGWSEEDRELTISLFPSLPSGKLDQFCSLTRLYCSLSQRVSTCQKQADDLENVLSAELRTHFDFQQPPITPRRGISPTSRWSIESGGGLSNDQDDSIKRDVYASRELTRVQCKEIHDLELNMRDLEQSLDSKKQDLYKLENMLLARVLEEQGSHQTDESDNESISDMVVAESVPLLVSENNTELPVWIKQSAAVARDSPRNHPISKMQLPFQPGDADSGINSMTSDENAVYSAKVSQSRAALETLV